jgi:isocitrate dehydrogenase
MKTTIAVAEGDGKGPDIMPALLRILDAAGAELAIEKAVIGEKAVHQGFGSGIDQPTLDLIFKAKFLLKGPTAVAGLMGELRHRLGLTAQLRINPEIDLAVISEIPHPNIEYRKSPDISETVHLRSDILKEKIIRAAFEYAFIHHRESVACAIDDRALFDAIATQYPDILNEGAGAAALMETPEIFDVVIAPPHWPTRSSESAYTIEQGDGCALFEAAHFPGLLFASLEMLAYIGQIEIAERIHNSYLVSIEKREDPKILDAIIRNLGKKPAKPAIYRRASNRPLPPIQKAPERKLVGIDVAIYYPGRFETLLPLISHIAVGPMRLKMISNRGIRVWPHAAIPPGCIEEWCCRFTTDDGRRASQNDCVQILHAFDHVNMDIVGAQHLYQWAQKPGTVVE